MRGEGVEFRVSSVNRRARVCTARSGALLRVRLLCILKNTLKFAQKSPKPEPPWTLKALSEYWYR